ncbi:MAG: ABC transporter ATP-binding protein [Anaerolineales bacterium]|jgi:ABC-2 type transport system ATP-binding protein
MKSIEVDELTREFNGLTAVNRIRFEVEQGEIFGFLGPNGAGKTTTVRMLTGQLRPTSGRAHVMGCDIVEDREQLKPQIGVVFEQQNLYTRFNALDNLKFYARLYGMPRARIARVLERVGLSSRAGDRIDKYSNGMRQRLMIARALLHEPRVLFLDEPTRGLDPGVARDIRSLIAELAREDVTIFLTTHYMEEADRLCSRVAIINKGAIVALAPPAELKSALGSSATLEDVFLAKTGYELYRPTTVSQEIN